MCCTLQAALALQLAQRQALQKALMAQDSALDLVRRRRRKLVSSLQAAAAAEDSDVGHMLLADTVCMTCSDGEM